MDVEAGDERGGDFFGAAVLSVAATGEGEQGGAGAGVGGDDGADLGELAGAAAVLEGVEVAAGRAGTGAAATSGTFGAAGGMPGMGWWEACMGMSSVTVGAPSGMRNGPYEIRVAGRRGDLKRGMALEPFRPRKEKRGEARAVPGRAAWRPGINTPNPIFACSLSRYGRGTASSRRTVYLLLGTHLRAASCGAGTLSP